MRLPQIAQFDVTQGIAINDRARTRYNEDQKMSRLQQIGQMASQGDLKGASAQAFAGGDLNIGASLRQMSQTEQAKLVEDAAAWAYQADSPEKWEAGRPEWTQRGFDIGDYGSREALLSRALSVKEQMAIDMQRENAARAQANADRTFGLQRERLNIAQQQAGRGQTQKAPAGYRWTQEGGLEPIPGGPAAQKANEAEAGDRARTDSALAQADRLIAKTDEALSNVSGFTSGFGGAVTGLIPGTSSRDLAADLQTIKANLGFAELQAMREASPTGGALGQVAVQELVALQSTVASLDQSQSEEQLRQGLEQVRQHYMNWRNTVIQARQGGAQGGAQGGGWQIEEVQ